uniref:Uncharacterized protein n=1 Tax=Zea mays TaxID=4577 RepID=C4J2H5_MAIZE|nr:unknown [Zea mays]
MVQDHEHRAGDREDRARDLGLAVHAPQPHLLHAQDQGHDERDGREDVYERRREAGRGQVRPHVVEVLVQHRFEHGEPHYLEEDGDGHPWPRVPLEPEREWRHDGGGAEVTVHDEDEVAHPALERGHGHDVHPGEAYLQQDHGQVRLHVVQNFSHAHFISQS